MIRRKFLARLTMTSSALLAGGTNLLRAGSIQSKRNKEDSIQLVHITDSHVFHKKNCPQHFQLFLNEIYSRFPAPDIIFHTGDVIMDALEADRLQVQKQWSLWQNLAKKFPIDLYYAIGNHDIWGHGPKSDPMYGKKWAMEEMGLENRFYSFRKGNWKFIVLDSTQTINGQWYTAIIDEVQEEWLKGELDNTPNNVHVMIISHIPILSASIFGWAKSENGFWKVKNTLMHADSHSLQAILRNFPQVKLCISGHLHLLDKVSYDGIDYLGNGAVSASWWGNNVFQQTPGGFASFQLYPDGAYERAYYTYKWL